MTTDGDAAASVGNGRMVIQFNVIPPVAQLVNGSPPSEGTPTATINACASAAVGGVSMFDWDVDGNGTVDLTGTSCSITFPQASFGAYTSTVSIADQWGHVSSASVSYVLTSNFVPPVVVVAASVVKPTITSTWLGRKLRGTMRIKGTVSNDATLEVVVTDPRTRKTWLQFGFNASKGPWSQLVALPSGLGPGRYNVLVRGKDPTKVNGSATDFTLVTPLNGTIAQASGSARKNGPPASAIHATSQLWGRFLFGYVPATGRKITTQWISPSGKKLAAVPRPRLTRVDAELAVSSSETVPAGRWQCVLRVGNVVVSRITLRVS